MNKNNFNITENIQFRLFLVLAGILVVFKLFIAESDHIIYRLVCDFLIIAVVTFLFLSLMFFLEKKKVSPISLIMNIGIFNAVVFFLIMFSEAIMSLLFENVNEKLNYPSLISLGITLAYAGLVGGFITYVFVALRHLFFLKQSSNQQVYFFTMVVFFLLAALTANYFQSDELFFISNTFMIISVLLMLINSLRISWIAFIVKKEKIALLILSIVIAVLFIVNLSNTGDVNAGEPTVHKMMLESLSPTLLEFTNIIMIYGTIYFGVLFFTTLFHIPTAEAFDRKAEEVSSLQYFSKLITQVLDFNELAETVTDITTRVSSADASWIIWKENDDFVSIANKNIGFVDSNLINSFILGKVDWKSMNDTAFLRLRDFERISELSQPYKAVAVSPLKAHGEVKGLHVAVRKNEDRFSEEDKNAIATFADYASVSIENSRLLEESIEKERLEKELDVAREIQKKILPDENPKYENLEISSVFVPAFEVGGDYYDFFKVSDSKLGFVIADVSGKGISAAFIMAEVKGIFESLSKTIESPRDILINANEILKSTLDSKTFVSAAYGLIDMGEGKMSFARAGHCPALYLKNDVAQNLRPSGIGLGLSNDKHFEDTLEEINIDLDESDTIVLYTDGITEAKNENLDDFGEKYFIEILLENRNKQLSELTQKVIQEVSMFSHNHSQYDDITLVILKWKQKTKLVSLGEERGHDRTEN
ncbi:MAG: SpoIIE family protein phosphatase [Ignavibacterium sp.]|nr:MAG: SpoIIE family protein phosphatase [Ignavibacterium sp.]